MADRLTVAVIGAGLMGHGIAQVFARAGHAVVLIDPDAPRLAQARRAIAHNLAQENVEAKPVLDRLATTTLLSQGVYAADLVIEAVPEKLALKQDLFAEVAQHAPPQAVLASNTSVIPITEIGRPLPEAARGRLLGTHWWNPPHLIPLVEVVQSEVTQPDVIERVMTWLTQAGKTPVRVERDIAGFIGNRLQHALWREAIALVEAGVCDAQAIDTVVKNSFGLRLSILGPMENADLVGLELTRDVHRILFPHLCTAATPSSLLDEKIGAGHLGMTAGEGLRPWPPGEADAVRQSLARHLIETLR